MAGDSLKVLAICGSNRTGSYNQKLLNISIQLLADLGVKCRPISVETNVLPVFSPDLSVDRETANLILNIRAEIAASDGIIVCSPQMNGSIPSFLKNLIDWLVLPVQTEGGDTVFTGKIVCLLGAAHGTSTALGGLAHLSTVFGYLGAIVVPQYYGVSHVEKAIAENGDVVDAKVAASLAHYINSFCSLLKKF